MRPYSQFDIHTLEELAEKHWGDADVLSQLIAELAHHSKKRARELKARVEGRLAELSRKTECGARPDGPAAAPKPRLCQGTLFAPEPQRPAVGPRAKRADPGDKEEEKDGQSRRPDRVARIRSPQAAKGTRSKWIPEPSKNIKPTWKQSDPAPVRFEKALRLLVQDMKRQHSGAQTITLENGQRIGLDGAEFAYRFRWQGDEELFEGAAVEIILGNRTTPGRIVSLGAAELVIDAERDLGPAIRTCILRVDNTAMLVALADRMAALAGTSSPTTAGRTVRGAGPFNHALADGVLTNSGPKEAPVVPAAEDLLAGLNDKQCAAARAALSLPISYLWGPPGTGKTKSLSAVMRALFAAERRSLVCSNTNQAVDQVLAQLCEELAGKDPSGACRVEALREGWVVRVGAIATDGPLAPWTDWVSLDGVAARKTKELKERLTALEERASAIEHRVLLARQTLQAFGDLEQATAAEATADQALRAAAADASTRQRALTEAEVRLAALRTEL
jgi:hypothetical protein